MQSNEPADTVSVASFTNKFRPRQVQYVPSPPYMQKLAASPRIMTNDPLISNATITKKSQSTNSTNDYPQKLLQDMVNVNKILAVKKLKIKKLKELNSEAEKRRSVGESLPLDFERKYAG